MPKRVVLYGSLGVTVKLVMTCIIIASDHELLITAKRQNDSVLTKGKWVVEAEHDVNKVFLRPVITNVSTNKTDNKETEMCSLRNAV